MNSLRTLSIVVFGLLTGACSYLVEKQTSKFTQRLSETIINHSDPQTVSEAIPTLLILVDSLAGAENASADAQLSAAQLYGAYSGAFVRKPERQKILTTTALDYARKGSCRKDVLWCHIEKLDQKAFSLFVQRLGSNDVELSYTYAVAWLSYIQAHSDDWNAVANLAKPKQLLEFVVEHNEAYENASAHLYLAAIALSIPPALGGKPEVSKQHFDRAIELTGGRNLVVKVEYARRYARLVFDKSLHHQLLTQTLEAETEQPGLTLMNVWAQQEAQQLLDDEADYFD